MNKPLSVTSTTNFHALGNYGTLTLLGIFYTFTPRAQALDEMLTPRLAGVLMASMIALGFAALVIAVTAARRKDPTALLQAEAIVLALLVIVLVALLTAVLLKWGLIVAMTSSVLLFGILFGSAGRAWQAWAEYRRLMKARRAPRATIEVAAEPDRE
jgi:hypothetical protein